MAATSVPYSKFAQPPIAIIGLACRLPGHSTSLPALWDMLLNGRVAATDVPSSRFKFRGHWDGSGKPCTMKSPGGMFLEDIDPSDIDAGFFKLSRLDAVSMDPNQRQLLEVVYEGLENAGITMETLKATHCGCFVGSYASGMFLPSIIPLGLITLQRLLRYARPRSRRSSPILDSWYSRACNAEQSYQPFF